MSQVSLETMESLVSHETYLLSSASQLMVERQVLHGEDHNNDIPDH
jgi:hypothetical protein